MIKTTYKFFLILILSLGLIQPVFSYDEDDFKIGSDEAKVTVKVFSSLTCPHCASFHKNIFDKLKKEYIDLNKVKFEHRGFPLDMAALNAEKILRCGSSSTNKFEFLSEIYNKQNEWAVGSNLDKINKNLIKIGLKYNLTKSQMENCLIDNEIQDFILKERIEAQKKYEISSTPTIYINNKKYDGKHKFKNFKKQIDELL
tara:strand:+ start:2529 stop:3128 length:600 start_codon:yes stop_codon:yes gene_type:complete